MPQDDKTSLEDELQEAIKSTTEPPEAASEPTEDEPPVLVQQREPPPTEPEEPSEGEKQQLLQSLREKYGEDLTSKYSNDDELLKGLINAHHMVGKRDQDAALWKAFSQDPDGTLAQWGYVKAQQPVQQQMPQPQQQNAGVPEYDEAWLQQVERDPMTGAITGTKPGFDPAVAGKLRRAEQWATKRQQELLFHPEKVIEPILNEKIKAVPDLVQQAVGQKIAAYQVYNEAWQWLNSEQNKKWIFNNGNPQKGLSEQGQRFYAHVKDGVENHGLSENDLPGLIKYATDQLELEWYRSKQQPKAKPTRRAPATAFHSPNVADQGEDEDTRIQDGESLEDAMRRIVGIGKR